VRHRRWWLVLVTACLAVVGVLMAVATFDGRGTYRDIARSSGVAGATFQRGGEAWSVDLDTMVELHEQTLEYVLGSSSNLPHFAATTAPLFDSNESSHLADVRNIFLWLRPILSLGLAIVILTAFRLRNADVRQLLRDGALISGALFGVIGIAAAVAFDPLFLLFHEIFFPQGNFLFGPDSNLIAMYPDPYWYGVTLRVGVTFVAAMAIIAIALSATLRQARR
jgi:integral membrane protein (TIGR01906 family)